MSRTQIPLDTRKLLVERVAASRYIGRSARLRSLLLYLCERVLEHGAQEIHEQEVGPAVFGRALDYDTISDNIVRVHASTLRKRLEQYFSSEGRDEPVIIELPKGNYAPVFSDRRAVELVPALPAPEPVRRVPPPPVPVPKQAWKLWLLAGIILFTIFGLLVTIRQHTRSAPPGLTAAHHGLWSQIFAAGTRTDIVLDDEGIGLYQELTGTKVALSDYFNRNYLRSLGRNPSNRRLTQEDAGSIVLKRQSSYASANLLWKLGAIAAEAKGATSVHFARDYTFRELQVNNSVLIGNAASNPWIEAFQDRIGLRWKYDANRGAYDPVDTWSHAAASGDTFRTTGDGYAMIALVPNLGGTGIVLILSSSGGAAMNAAGEFLADNECVRRLNSLLPNTPRGTFPYFEALLRVKSRSRQIRDTSIVICRKPRI